MSTTGLDTPDRQQSGEKYYGKYPGLVVDNQSRENEDHRGEVLVEVSGILEDRDDKQLPMQAWAKPCFMPGFFFVPEKGDQVWVEFAAGDINFPIWTGVWYPKGKTPQTTDDKAPTEAQKIIRSTSKSKLIVQLNDGDGCIEIKDKDGNSILLNDKGVTISSGKAIMVKASVSLGDEKATEPLLLGNEFNTSIWTLFANHSHATAMGPTGTPIPPISQIPLPLSKVVTTK